MSVTDGAVGRRRDMVGKPGPQGATDRLAGLVGLAVVAVVALAFGLRLGGLAYGLPAVYNPDEVSILSRALAFAKGDLNPHNFLYPSLYFYVLFAWIGGYFVLGRLAGAFGSLAAFEAQFFVDPTGFYLAGRALTLVCAVATIALVWWLGRRLFGRAAGVTAALFLAVAPFHVRDSHYIKHDVPAALAVTIAYLAISRIWPLRARRLDTRTPVVIAAAACGGAVSIHYYAVFLALPLALALVFRYEADGWRAVVTRGVTAALVATAAFFVCSPFILVEPVTAWRDIVANRQIVMDRAITTGGGFFASAGRYLQMLGLEALGWPVALLGAIGTVWLTARSPRRGMLLLAFPLPFLLFLSNTVPASRYLNPVLPVAALLAAYAVVRLSQVIAARRSPVTLAVMAALACLPGLAASVGTDRFFRQTDTRTLALQFIEAHVPAGSTILVQPYSVPLTQSRESLVEALEANLGDVQRASTKFALRLRLPNVPAPAYRTLFLGDGGLDADKIYLRYAEVAGSSGFVTLRSRGVQYIVVKRYNKLQPATQPFLDALPGEGRRIAVFSPYRPDASPTARARVEPFLHNTDARIDQALERPGPVVEIWQLNDPRS